MRTEILRRLSNLSGALAKVGVRRLSVFGSVARGDDRPDSDLDLLVTLDPPSFDAYFAAKFVIEDALHRRVDLVTDAALKPAMRAQVLAEAVDVPGI